MLDSAKTFTELLAFMGAALFFGFKFYNGYFIINLTVLANATRHPLSDDDDLLVIECTAEKGGNNTVEVHCISAFLNIECKSAGIVCQKVLQFEEVARCVLRPYPTDGAEAHLLRVTPIKFDDTHLIDSSQSRERRDDHPYYNLPPGEKGSWQVSCRVPKESIVGVDVVVTGVTRRQPYQLHNLIRKFVHWRYTNFDGNYRPSSAQWRTTVVSPPLASIPVKIDTLVRSETLKNHE